MSTSRTSSETVTVRRERHEFSVHPGGTCCPAAAPCLRHPERADRCKKIDVFHLQRRGFRVAKSGADKYQPEVLPDRRVDLATRSRHALKTSVQQSPLRIRQKPHLCVRGPAASQPNASCGVVEPQRRRLPGRGFQHRRQDAVRVHQCLRRQRGLQAGDPSLDITSTWSGQLQITELRQDVSVRGSPRTRAVSAARCRYASPPTARPTRPRSAVPDS